MQLLADVQADGHKIKRIRSDDGLEFCNEQVNSLFLKNNIKHEVLERQTRTVLKSAKAMFHIRQLPLYLCADATNTAVFVKNRAASAVIEKCTP